MRIAAYILLGGSAVAAGFLVYSLLNLRGLGIDPMHPRVLVEAGLAIGLFACGLWLLRL